MPTQLLKPGLDYLAEGGQETELMYGYGFALPHFALFPLLDNPAAVERLTAMYASVCEVAATHGYDIEEHSLVLYVRRKG